ncbi:hypothetical protein [Methylopila sp. Yamaguchi]|uniref:hypothetical protein n=1 Tax=Methylopila sp. Yamaguchi TaxID=1437817 RepID=UPI001357A0AD|nr:hypothetical protein [Methylopila sp. Yamaguchi]
MRSRKAAAVCVAVVARAAVLGASLLLTSEATAERSQADDGVKPTGALLTPARPS